MIGLTLLLAKIDPASTMLLEVFKVTLSVFVGILASLGVAASVANATQSELRKKRITFFILAFLFGGIVVALVAIWADMDLDPKLRDELRQQM